MSDQAFADATRPTPNRAGLGYTILRLPMRDYSLGHELLLIRDRNALLLSEELFNDLPPKEQGRAIVRAVFVCARSWIENQRPMSGVRLWGWMVRKDFEGAFQKFRDYRMQGSSFPNVLPADGAEDARALGAPFMARLTAFACECFGQAAFDQPFGMLQWMYFSRAEGEGSCRIENDHERQVREELEQHKADYAREQALKKPRRENE